MREVRLGAAIRFERGEPVGRLRVTSGKLPNSLKVPRGPVSYVIGKQVDVIFNPGEEAYPFISILSHEVGGKVEAEARKSTTREALVYLMALSKPIPGESHMESLTINEVANEGAKALAGTICWFLERSTGSVASRYKDELTALRGTGLLDSYLIQNSF
jgi:hypothetical protein